MINDYLHGVAGAQQADGIHRPAPQSFISSSGIGLTADSYVSDEPPSEDIHVITRPSPLWLPPALLSKCLKTSIWKVVVDITPSGDQSDIISGSFEYEVVAGTARRLGFLAGAEIEDTITNEPGWTSVRDAVEFKRHRKPPPDEDDYSLFTSGFASFELSLQEENPEDVSQSLVIGLNLNIGAWFPSNKSTRPPDSGVAKPRWNDRDGLESVWVWALNGGMTSFLQTEFGTVNNFSSNLINYEEEKSGRANVPGGNNADEYLKVTVSHGTFFSDV